jgi:hypothetical protein
LRTVNNIIRCVIDYEIKVPGDSGLIISAIEELMYDMVPIDKQSIKDKIYQVIYNNGYNGLLFNEGIEDHTFFVEANKFYETIAINWFKTKNNKNNGK